MRNTLGIFVIFLSLFLSVNSLAQNNPYLSYGNLYYADGSSPGSVTFSAYILSRAGEVLDQNSFGCGYDNIEGLFFWFVQCGSFETQWEPGDLLRVEFSDNEGRTGSIEVPLTASAADDAGNTTLTANAHPAKLLAEDRSVTRGQNITVNIHMENWALADSLVAYELTLGFNNEVLLALGAESGGTMTRNWDSLAAAPKETKLVIGGFTTNQPDKRLNTENDILVKAAFQVHGIPSTQTSNETLVRILRARFYTSSDEEIIVSHTRTGLLKVMGGAGDTTVNITIYPGWNLISLGIAPEPNLIPDILGNLNVAYISAYSGGHGPRTWSSIRPSFLNDLNMMDGVRGYWIRSAESNSVVWEMNGTSIPVDTPLQLYTGWNLIGYLPGADDIIEHAFSTLDDQFEYVMGYNAAGPVIQTWSRARPGELNDLLVLKPKMGYWIRMNSSRNLVYPGLGYSVPKAVGIMPHYKSGSDHSKTVMQPDYCDFWAWQPTLLTRGDSIKVYTQGGILCGDTTVTVEGAFLVHVRGNDSTTPDIINGAVEGEELIFTVNGDTAIVVGTSASLDTTVIVGEPALFEASGDKRVKLALPSVSVLEETGSLPETCGLLPNYPNPFNASTVISFTLDRPDIVTLRVFDIQGRLIKTLLDREKVAAGIYRAEWTGINHTGRMVSSGVYVIRMEASNGVFTQKVVFIN